MTKTKYHIWLGALIFLLSQCAMSHPKEESGRQFAAEDIPSVITVPFHLTPNKMIAVQAKLDSLQGWFIFDTGSPRTMVNRRYFHPSRQRSRSYSRITDVSGVPMLGRDTYNAHELDFQGILEENKQYLSIEMSQMEREDGIETLGMIGAETLQGYDVLYDYADSTLTFIRPADTDAYLAAVFPTNTLHEAPLSIVEHVPCVEAKIGDDTYQLGIDCGAGGGVLSQTYRRQLANYSRPVGAMELTGISRIPVRVTQIEVFRMEIAGKLFTGMEFLLHNLRTMGIEAEDGIDGLVGYDVLSQQKTLISTENKRVVFID
ncbi:MAG: hypothetical protein J6T82_05930 [Bacteroidaceae bacterium]|nr:hypothetical protein [Bacteroidaceae bacterium]